MIRLLMAEDHTLVREGLKQLFAEAGGLTVAGEATDGGQVLELLWRGCFDLLLLDVSMPGLSGEELINCIRTRYPSLPILVLSMHNEPQIVRRTLQAGASGYLTKDCDPDTLLTAIHRLADGGRFIAPELAEHVVFDMSAGLSPILHERLTDREQQVLELLVKGHSLKDIASRLVISHKTVSTHKTRLMKKMNMANNAELIRYCVAEGLVG